MKYPQRRDWHVERHQIALEVHELHDADDAGQNTTDDHPKAAVERGSVALSFLLE